MQGGNPTLTLGLGSSPARRTGARNTLSIYGDAMQRHETNPDPPGRCTRCGGWRDIAEDRWAAYTALHQDGLTAPRLTSNTALAVRDGLVTRENSNDLFEADLIISAEDNRHAVV